MLRRPLSFTIQAFGARVFSGRRKIKFDFVHKGKVTSVEGFQGDTILQVALDNEFKPLEGACEGTMACSTCHVILPKNLHEILDEPCEQEQDLLDLAPGVEPSSRLGCQIQISKDFEGQQIKLPDTFSNQMV